MTKVLEISVPAQKNSGGENRDLEVVFINATVQGNEPRLNSCPRIINPNLTFETPQVSLLLRDPLIKADDTTAIAKMTTAVKKYFVIASNRFRSSESELRLISAQQRLTAKIFSQKYKKIIQFVFIS